MARAILLAILMSILVRPCALAQEGAVPGSSGPGMVLPLAVLATVLALLLAVRWVERSRRRRSVRESERRYLELLQQAPDVIFTVDLDGVVLSVNEAGERVLGAGRRPVRGERLENLMAGDSALRVRRMLLDALEGQEAPTYLLEVDGGAHRVPLEIRTREVVQDGVIVALQGIGRDVSERQLAERVLRNLTVALAARRGVELFDALVEGLVRELGVDHALIGEIADSRGIRIRTLASWCRDAPGEALEYALEGAPCARVMEGAVHLVESGARDRYPDDELLREANAEAYVGAPLFDSDGRVFGLLAVLHTEPLREPEVAKSILRAFSVRVADELERYRASPDGRDRGADGPGAPRASRRTA